MRASRAETIKLAANGNAHAEAFLSVYVGRCHFVDDLADESERPKPDQIAAFELDWLICLSANPFFLQHAQMLVPLMVVGLNAWVDSEGMPRNTQTAAAVRDVVKSQYTEVVYAVAWLTGGWQKLRALTSAHREYDLEGPTDPAANFRKKLCGCTEATICPECAPGRARKESDGPLRT